MIISKYTNIIKEDGRYLLHNSMYNTALMVYNRDLRGFINSIETRIPFEESKSNKFHNILKSLCMIVDENEDELATLNSRFFYFEHSSELYIMLIVTRRCNFRCAYCYEDYINSDMHPEVFKNVRRFIIDQINKNHYKNIYVSFFGGEPTLMAEEINGFMEELLKENADLPSPAYIRAIITTNGYLL